MYPAEKAKLLFQIAFLKRHDEADEADCVKREAENTMVCRKGEQLGVCEDDMLRTISLEKQHKYESGTLK
jgi:hypothetical protein